MEILPPICKKLRNPFRVIMVSAACNAENLQGKKKNYRNILKNLQDHRIRPTTESISCLLMEFWIL